MRDGLSLLDQALAYGAEKLTDSDVAEMLGSMDRYRIVALLDLLVAGNGADLITAIHDLDELVPDYAIVLDEIATTLQRIAVIQVAGADAVEDEDELESLTRLAGDIEPERIQLYYQMAVRSRGDLLLAPEPRIGFEMALLRMLAFHPAGGVEGEVGGGSVVTQPIRRAAPEAAKPRRKRIHRHRHRFRTVGPGGRRNPHQNGRRSPLQALLTRPRSRISITGQVLWPGYRSTVRRVSWQPTARSRPIRRSRFD